MILLLVLRSRLRSKLFDIAAEQLKDDLFGFRMATDFELRKIGLPYYICSSSNTLADALSDAERYTRIVNDGIQLRIHQDRATADCSRLRRSETRINPAPNGVLAVWDDPHVATTHRHPIGATSTEGQAFPGRAAPPEFRTFLGCDVEFASDANEIIFPKIRRFASDRERRSSSSRDARAIRGGGAGR